MNIIKFGTRRGLDSLQMTTMRVMAGSPMPHASLRHVITTNMVLEDPLTNFKPKFPGHTLFSSC